MRVLVVAFLGATSVACFGGGGGGGGGGEPVFPGADPSFGDGGLATVNFGGGLSGLMAVARQEDGKIVGLGGTRESIALVRVNANGTLDGSFGEGGIVQLPWGAPTNGVDKAHGIAIQPDGKILVTARVLGVYGALVSQPVVVRLMPNGDLDTTFATTGYFLSERQRDLRTLALQPDGKIVAGGSGRLERLLADGTRDTTFGTDGVATTDILVQDLALQADGKLVAVGGRTIARYTSTGALDLAFAGSSGKITLADADAQLWSVALASDGKILAGGQRLLAPATEPAFAITRYDANGTLDSAFGSSGIAHDANPDGNSIALGIGIAPDGKIVGIGYANVGGTSPGRSARFDSTGALDASFGNGGAGALVNAVVFADPAFEDDGAVVTAGAWLGSGTFQSSLVRMTASGAADAEFGNAGTVGIEIGGSFDRVHHLALQSDGSVIASGWAADATGAAVVRLGPDGAHDLTFGVSGSTVPVYDADLAYVGDAIVQADDSIVVTGLTYRDGFSIVRFDANGQLDTAFGIEGIVRAEPIAGLRAISRAIAQGPDGSIYVAGDTATASGTSSEYAVVKLSPDGVRDMAYGGSGAALTSFGSGVNIATHLEVQPDGKAVTLGLTTGLTLVRFDAAGMLDSTFGAGGVTTMPDTEDAQEPFNLLLQPDGKLVAVLGNFRTGTVVLARFGADGQKDTSFGVDGVATFALAGGSDYYYLQAPMGAALLEDGRIVVGLAESSGAQLTESAALVWVNPDGTADESMGPGGIQSITTLGRGSSAFHAMVVQPNGKVLVGGRVWSDAGSSDFAVVRLD